MNCSHSLGKFFSSTSHPWREVHQSHIHGLSALELHRGFGDGSCLSRKDLPQGMKLFSNFDVFILRAG